MRWSHDDGVGDAFMLAAICRDEHPAGPTHAPPAQERSIRVDNAWKAAKAAHESPDPLVKEEAWGVCRGELDHDP